MSNYISGNDLLKKWDIKGFQLANYVKQGLLPYDQAGRPRLPESAEEQLIQLQNQANYWGRQKLIQLVMKQSNQRIIDIVKESTGYTCCSHH